MFGRTIFACFVMERVPLLQMYCVAVEVVGCANQVLQRVVTQVGFVLVASFNQLATEFCTYLLGSECRVFSRLVANHGFCCSTVLCLHHTPLGRVTSQANLLILGCLSSAQGCK